MRSTVALLLGLLLCSSCRTRPYEVGEVPDLTPPPDLTIPPDLTPPPDLTFFPDLTPPPDLVLPFICRDIYVIDGDSQLLSGFDTQKAAFYPVGRLQCPGVNGATPDTMAIARDGTAWVFYTGGLLFNVDVRTAACRATNFKAAQIGNQTFGSGFSADRPGGAAETLFVALAGDLQLASVDTQTLVLTRLADIPSSAELTGTAAAELWGYFPSNNSFIARIDKQTGALDSQIPLPQIRAVGGFAFSFWGGSFWIFNGDGPGNDTTVYQVDKQTGKVAIVLRNTGMHIVGAGVSSCAPLGLDQ